MKGRPTPQYKSNVGDSSDGWPPRFVKVCGTIVHPHPPLFLACGFFQFILFIQGHDASFTELAFCDARRLSRIRMALSPLNEPPISDLGFDPILSMPSIRDFRHTVSKRTCPIKALLLDQSFSAGIGNYLAGPHVSVISFQPMLNSLNSCGQMKFYIRLEYIPSNDAIP